MMSRYIGKQGTRPAIENKPVSKFERVFRHHERLVILALSVMTFASAIYTVLGIGMDMSAWQMTSMPRDMPMPTQTWTFGVALLMFLMWWVMMIAMMLPSAAPMIMLYARVVKRQHTSSAGITTAMFLVGYLVIWGMFSLVATIVHGLGEQLGWINGMMLISSSWLAGMVLLFAGVWQFLPIKARCLEACRQPVEFLSKIWRSGRIGAFKMGVHHGVFCVGCCWLMMALLFIGGVMNVYWIGALALFVLVEKLAPSGRLVRHVLGYFFLIGALSFFIGV